MGNDVASRKGPMNAAIVQVDPHLFNESLEGWLEITNYIMGQRAGRIKATEDGSVPPLSKSDLNLSGVQTIANDSVFAFCITASMAHDAAAISIVEKGLQDKYGENYPGSFALWHFRQDCEKPETLDDHIGMIGRALIEDKPFDPKDTWNAGIRFLEKARTSNFVVELTQPLAQWHRNEWKAILPAQQKTALHEPETNIPPIKEYLRRYAGRSVLYRRAPAGRHARRRHGTQRRLPGPFEVRFAPHLKRTSQSGKFYGAFPYPGSAPMCFEGISVSIRFV